jgi:hypothetical protein
MTTETLEQIEEPPRLPDDAAELHRVLWRENKRGSDGVESATRFAEIVAGTITRNYTMSPST